eukprot:jgi/Astpho2/1280/fgenesh1_pg.00023_%23_30_t
MSGAASKGCCTALLCWALGCWHLPLACRAQETGAWRGLVLTVLPGIAGGIAELWASACVQCKLRRMEPGRAAAQCRAGCSLALQLWPLLEHGRGGNLQQQRPTAEQGKATVWELPHRSRAAAVSSMPPRCNGLLRVWQLAMRLRDSALVWFGVKATEVTTGNQHDRQAVGCRRCVTDWMKMGLCGEQSDKHAAGITGVRHQGAVDSQIGCLGVIVSMVTVGRAAGMRGGQLERIFQQGGLASRRMELSKWQAALPSLQPPCRLNFLRTPVQDGLARQSAVADDPVNHPVPDKSFMCLSHIAALPIQPSCVSLRSTSLAAARRGTLELVKCKLQKTGTRGEWPYLGETLVGCPAVWDPT